MRKRELCFFFLISRLDEEEECVEPAFFRGNIPFLKIEGKKHGRVRTSFSVRGEKDFARIDPCVGKVFFFISFSPYCQKRGAERISSVEYVSHGRPSMIRGAGGDASAGCKDLLPQLYGEAGRILPKSVPVFPVEESVHFESGEEGK